MTSIFSWLKRLFKRKSYLLESIDLTVVPTHVAIIMDGNGRWAQRRGLPRLAGHRAGAKSVREVVELAPGLGIRYVTLYTFSAENWSRPKDEVSGLMKLFNEMLAGEIDSLHSHNVRLLTIGDLNGVAPATREQFKAATARTADNTGLTLIVAMNYGGRADILRGAAALARRSNGSDPDAELTEETFSGCLSTAGIPDPELVIRTSGELRLSNFLLWETAYSEFWVTNKLWPDFRQPDLLQAVYDYQQRHRRFGGLKGGRTNAD